MVTPSLAAARASELSVRTTPLTWGRQASVATRTRIRLLSAGNPCCRIACDDNCHFMSQQCDGRDIGATVCPRGALHCCYKQMKSCRCESSDRDVGQTVHLWQKADTERDEQHRADGPSKTRPQLARCCAQCADRRLCRR